MTINNFSKEFESYFLQSVISYDFRIERFVCTKFCEEAKFQNLGKSFAKFAKLFVKNNFCRKSPDFVAKLQDLSIFNGKNLLQIEFQVLLLSINCSDFYFNFKALNIQTKL